MSNPFTDLGLQDRTRVMPPPENLGANLGIVEVDELIIGAYRIYAGQGTRYANGKLIIEGREDNSVELKLKPGDKCQSKGVISQIEWVAKYAVNYFKRFAISIVFDGIGERVVIDSTSHENTVANPVYHTIGAKSRSDGTDVPNTEKIVMSEFWNGTHEFHLWDDTVRVEMNSFMEAFIKNDRRLMRVREKQADGSWKQVSYTNQ